jgi:cobalt-zinc-cadmium efflux system protein
MAHDHDHGADLAEQNGRRLAVVLSITGTVLVADVVGALLTGSLALLADAGHMLTDAAGLVLALLAARLVKGDEPRHQHRIPSRDGGESDSERC